MEQCKKLNWNVMFQWQINSIFSLYHPPSYKSNATVGVEATCRAPPWQSRFHQAAPMSLTIGAPPSLCNVKEMTKRSDSIISTILFPQHLINGINQCCHFLLVVHKAWPLLLWVDQLAIHLHLKPPRGWRCAFTSNLKITWEFILKLCLESGELGPVPSSTAVDDMNFDSHIASRSSPSPREIVVAKRLSV